MTRPLRSFPDIERKQVINRRISQGTKGIGYWSAIEAKAHLTGRPVRDIISQMSDNITKQDE